MLPLDCGRSASTPVLHVRRASTVVESDLELRACLLQWPMKPVVGRAPQPLLSSCPACQSAHLACSVKDCFEHPLCCCSGSFVATCLGRISSSLQWLRKANSSSDATAVSLVRQLSRCSACFCSPLWVRDMLRHKSQELHKWLFPIVGETKCWRFRTPKSKETSHRSALLCRLGGV